MDVIFCHATAIRKTALPFAHSAFCADIWCLMEPSLLLYSNNLLQNAKRAMWRAIMSYARVRAFSPCLYRAQ